MREVSGGPQTWRSAAGQSLRSDGVPFSDPGPEATESRGITLTSEWDECVGGIVGWSSRGWAALALASATPDLPRLAIVALPFPDDLDSPPADGQAPSSAVDLDAVAAKTLLLFGSKDPQTGSKHGRSWQKRLSNARLETEPVGHHDLLIPMWSRVLSHLAPGRTR